MLTDSKPELGVFMSSPPSSAPDAQKIAWAAYIPKSCRDARWNVHTPEHPKFKSRICRHYIKGYCTRGSACNFAHGWEDRRAYQNAAGKPEEMFIEHGNEKIEIITDWHILGHVDSS